MKTNRGIFFKANDTLTHQIHVLNNKIQNLKNHEVFLEGKDGVTNHASCKFNVINLVKYETKNKLKLIIQVSNEKDNFKEILFDDDYQDPLNKTFSL